MILCWCELKTHEDTRIIAIDHNFIKCYLPYLVPLIYALKLSNLVTDELLNLYKTKNLFLLIPGLNV